MSKTIGFVKSLYFYDINPYWIEFFRKLGYSIVFAEFERNSLPARISKFENELCLPIKYFLTQVEGLLEKSVDYIFAPLIYSNNRGVYCCPKIIMIVELIKRYFPSILQQNHNMLVSPIFYEQYEGIQSFIEYQNAAQKIGNALFIDEDEINKATKHAKREHLKFNKSLRKKFSPYENQILNLNDEMGKNKTFSKSKKHSPRILILGHKYTTLNATLNNGLLQEITRMGGIITTKEQIPLKMRDLSLKNIIAIDFDVYFSEGIEILNAAKVGFHSMEIHGIVYLSMFNCGFDAVLENAIMIKFAKHSPKPYLHVVLDEHSTKSNLMTKLEIFMEIIEMNLQKRRKKD